MNIKGNRLILAALAGLLAAVVACGGSDDPAPTVTRPAVTATATTAAEAGVGAAEEGARVNKGANLRGGPGTEYAIVGGAKAGTIVEPVAVNPAGDWYLLASGAWIAGFLVDGAPAGLPVASYIPPVPEQAPMATIAPAVAPTFDCECSRDAYNCSDAEANRCYDVCMERVGRDVHRLDRDGDGSPCERE